MAPNTGRESFGLVLVEAMAAGTPVVASDLDAFRDMCTGDDGRLHARLTPVGDAPALAGAIADALTAPTDVVAAAAHVRRFDWATVGPRIVDAYAAAGEHRHAGRFRG